MRRFFQLPQQPMAAARCINGNLVRPDNTDEEPPSTACRQSTVMAPGGVPLGRGPPGHQQSPGGLRGRNVPPPPPPPPPPPAPVAHAPAALNAASYPREWTPLNTRPRQQEEAVRPMVHPMIQAAAVVKEQMVNPVKVVIHIQEEEQQDLMGQEEEHPLHQGDSQEVVHLREYSTAADRRSRTSRRRSTVTSRDISTQPTSRSMGSIGQI